MRLNDPIHKRIWVYLQWGWIRTKYPFKTYPYALIFGEKPGPGRVAGLYLSRMAAMTERPKIEADTQYAVRLNDGRLWEEDEYSHGKGWLTHDLDAREIVIVGDLETGLSLDR